MTVAAIWGGTQHGAEHQQFGGQKYGGGPQQYGKGAPRSHEHPVSRGVASQQYADEHPHHGGAPPVYGGTRQSQGHEAQQYWTEPQPHGVPPQGHQGNGYSCNINSSYSQYDHPCKVAIPHGDEGKTQLHIGDKRKHQLKVGGAILGGATFIGGSIYAWHEHKKHKEEKKEHAAYESTRDWLHDRLEDLRRQGHKGPLTWILTEGHTIPPGVLAGGSENGQPLFIARAFHHDGLHIGKASPGLTTGASIGYDSEEIEVSTYEVLVVSDPSAVRWLPAHRELELDERHHPILGGREKDGSPLFILRRNITVASTPENVD